MYKTGYDDFADRLLDKTMNKRFGKSFYMKQKPRTEYDDFAGTHFEQTILENRFTSLTSLNANKMP